MTFQFLKNVLRYGIEMGYLDTDLERQNWRSSLFHFFAGDLYDVIPQLKEKHTPIDPITGNCKASDEGLKIFGAQYSRLYVYYRYNCELFVKQDKFLQLVIDIRLQLRVVPNSEAFIGLEFIDHIQDVVFTPMSQY